MPAFWTIRRASGIGASFGLVALLLWPFALLYPDILSWPLLGAALVAGLCGGSILLITIADLLFHRPRGPRLRPVRAFDLVLGAALLGLALLEAEAVAGQF
ncbi:MAG: hypothetical protein ACXW2T_04245 [Allosphingosinicella sp.]